MHERIRLFLSLRKLPFLLNPCSSICNVQNFLAFRYVTCEITCSKSVLANSVFTGPSAISCKFDSPAKFRRSLADLLALNLLKGLYTQSAVSAFDEKMITCQSLKPNSSNSNHTLRFQVLTGYVYCPHLGQMRH
jgi:hypothetical protein